MKVGKVNRKRIWDLRVGGLQGPHGKGYEVPGIGCFGRILGLRDVGGHGRET